MKIVAPISRVEEAAIFARQGADELFFGVIPQEWTKRFGRFTANRRSANNLDSLADVAEVVEQVHSVGKRTSVALNGTTHTAEQAAFVVELATALVEKGVDALIIGDIQVLAILQPLQLPVRIHISSTASCRNVPTARLMQKWGADRIILPRHTSLEEIRVLASGVPDLEFEAFVLNDGCPYEEGLCHSLHLPTELGGPLCFESFDSSVERLDGQPESADERKLINHNAARYGQWRWSKFSRGFTTTASGQPYGPCGLCAIPLLKEMGIEHIKIAGRDGNPERKQRSLEMVGEIAAQTEDAVDCRDIMHFARHIRGEPELCQNSDMCYYPEVVTK
ncbi:MAG: U32 family peptidase [Halieaceae bacterium]|jgi:U32 family peptidase|nr:U32 family peptidase [Halieaceae bacterium]